MANVLYKSLYICLPPKFSKDPIYNPEMAVTFNLNVKLSTYNRVCKHVQLSCIYNVNRLGCPSLPSILCLTRMNKLLNLSNDFIP